MRCDAILRIEPGDFPGTGTPVICRQSVGVHRFWSNTGQVGYCALAGHEQNVRRRFAEVDPPMPTFLHESPDFIDHDPDERYAPDPIDLYKSWTDAGWTESELREAFGG